MLTIRKEGRQLIEVHIRNKKLKCITDDDFGCIHVGFALKSELLFRKKMNHCKGLCLILAIAQGKVGEEIGDGSSIRKYCAICEIYFGLSVEVTRCPCCKNVLRCPLRSSNSCA